jgi:hypothetical protein
LATKVPAVSAARILAVLMFMFEKEAPMVWPNKPTKSPFGKLIHKLLIVKFPPFTVPEKGVLFPVPIGVHK